MNDALPKIAKVLNPLMSKHKMLAKYPLPVWDDTGSLIGVEIFKDKQMGPQKCMAIASFVLTPADLASDKRMTDKAMLAINAIEQEVQMSIRPLREKRAA